MPANTDRLSAALAGRYRIARHLGDCHYESTSSGNFIVEPPPTPADSTRRPPARPPDEEE